MPRKGSHPFSVLGRLHGEVWGARWEKKLVVRGDIRKLLAMRMRKRQNQPSDWLNVGGKNKGDIGGALLKGRVSLNPEAVSSGCLVRALQSGAHSVIMSMSLLLLLTKCEKRKMSPLALKTPKKRTVHLTTGA